MEELYDKMFKFRFGCELSKSISNDIREKVYHYVNLMENSPLKSMYNYWIHRMGGYENTYTQSSLDNVEICGVSELY